MPNNPTVGYIMSRFPKLTETFVLYEMLELERLGVDVEIYPLHREKCTLMHPQAQALVDRAHFTTLLSWAVVCANLYWMTRKPLAYLGVWMHCLWATLGSARYFFGILAVVPLASSIARRMQRDGVEHVHAHFASHPAAAGLVIGRLTGLPYSFTAHGSDLHRERRMLRDKIEACKFAVAISSYNRDWILRECGSQFAEKTHIVHCGVDSEQFGPSELRGQSEEGLQIVCVGTLHEVKGQAHLLRACGILRRDGVAIQLHLIGDGPDRNALEQLAVSEQIADCTIFHGPLSRPQVLEQLSTADVAVAPSVISSDGRREGIPVVLMEAMASALPVVASRLSGIPELVDDQVTGCLTTPGDTKALASAIRSLADDSDWRRELGRAGLEKVQREFHLQLETRRLAELFGCTMPPESGVEDAVSKLEAPV